MSDDASKMTASQIAYAVRSGSRTAESIMSDYLARISARDTEIKAFIDFDPERALSCARAADKMPKKGPLHGVPYAIKDIIDTVDLPTAWGSPIYAGFQPRRNASCVELLNRAGAVPLGKTVTTEFAYFSPGPTRNPHGLKHTPGGSSSGSAAAVADGMAAFSLGSQTAASLTRPAAYCGVFGYKSTQGSLDGSGVMSLSSSLDSLGLMARSVDDLMLTLNVLHAEPDVKLAEPFSSPTRIGFFRGPLWQEGSLVMREACELAAKTLALKGIIIEDVDCPDELINLTEHHKTVMAFEVARARIFEYSRHHDQLSPAFADLVETGLNITRTTYETALLARNQAGQTLARIFQKYDALMTPAAPSSAPAGIAATGDPLFSRMWSLLRTPSISIPYGSDEANMPLAFQLIGGLGQDQRLLAHARGISSKLDIEPSLPLT
ncbi:amidase [Candidatus Puniceispirillum marinum]|uniref:Amidase n=1 Tax=Puniceispirillum marinum (strain IMCC1322) TaxID=488538 RepID=D5BUK8_PUNMI|nr:amidase [Candidatus Puniceispirillum marinum]ADE39955.1 amidase [Candidatus Puniceispirillum marinum IMCC1322]